MHRPASRQKPPTGPPSVAARILRPRQGAALVCASLVARPTPAAGAAASRNLTNWRKRSSMRQKTGAIPPGYGFSERAGSSIAIKKTPGLVPPIELDRQIIRRDALGCKAALTEIGTPARAKKQQVR